MLLALGLIVVAFLLVVTDHPQLYDARTAAMTPSHADLSEVGRATRTDGGLVLPEWERSLHATGPVVVSIRRGDSKAAASYLEADERSSVSLASLVYRLELTSTDVGEFQRNNTLNTASLEHLLNQSLQFEQLIDQEDQARRSGNGSALASVLLERDDLEKAMKANYQSYAARRDLIVNLSHEYGLDTSEYEQSVLNFKAVVTTVEAMNDGRPVSASGTSPVQ